MLGGGAFYKILTRYPNGDSGMVLPDASTIRFTKNISLKWGTDCASHGGSAVDFTAVDVDYAHPETFTFGYDIVEFSKDFFGVFLYDLNPTVAQVLRIWLRMLLANQSHSIITGVSQGLMFLTHSAEKSNMPPGLYKVYCETPEECFFWTNPIINIPPKIFLPLASGGNYNVMFIQRKTGPYGPDDTLTTTTGMSDGMYALVNHLGGFPKFNYPKQPNTARVVPSPEQTVAFCLETELFKMEIVFGRFYTLHEILGVACVGNYDITAIVWSPALNHFLGELLKSVIDADVDQRVRLHELGFNCYDINPKVGFTSPRELVAHAPVPSTDGKTLCYNFMNIDEHQIDLPEVSTLMNLNHRELCEVFEGPNLKNPLEIQMTRLNCQAQIVEFFSALEQQFATIYPTSKIGGIRGFVYFNSDWDNKYYIQLLGFKVTGGLLLKLFDGTKISSWGSHA